LAILIIHFWGYIYKFVIFLAAEAETAEDALDIPCFNEHSLAALSMTINCSFFKDLCRNPCFNGQACGRIKPFFKENGLN